MDQPPLYPYKAGRQLYRLHDSRFGALSPNPFTGVNTKNPIKPRYSDGTLVAGRFAPFSLKSEGPALPALYISETAQACYYEYLFRPHDGKATFVELEHIEKLAISCITFKQDLKLADCRRLYLEDGAEGFWPFPAVDVYDSRQLLALEFSRKLAHFVMEKYPDLDGLVWDSVRYPNNMVGVLFGERRDGDTFYQEPIWDDLSSWRPELITLLNEGKLNIDDRLGRLL